MLRGFWLGAVLAVAGCGDGETVGEPSQGKSGGAGMATAVTPICEAGRQVECPCANGGKGAQACASDGSKWEVCACEGVKPVAPEKSPAEACGPPDNQMLAPVDACPVDKPWNYVDVRHCLDAYVASGVCAPNKSNFFVCCPVE